jgi:hypothetical protein
MCLGRKPIAGAQSCGDGKRRDETGLRIIQPEITAMKRRHRGSQT